MKGKDSLIETLLSNCLISSFISGLLLIISSLALLNVTYDDLKSA